jgi:protein-L-isoaspartate(D-aspartate) O-methyltransferase
MRPLLFLSGLVLVIAVARAEAPAQRPPAPADSLAAPAAGWARPRSSERSAERDAMVRQLLRYPRPRVSEERVIEAMRAVPRHWFVPEANRGNAYVDSPLAIGHGQTISQPYIVAIMTQLAVVRDTMRVLEVGTGSGYQAAVLNELTPEVYTLEIVGPLARRVEALFLERGYEAIHAAEGDGYFGWPEAAPFDRILVTAAAAHIPPPLVRQLAPGGRMVIPVGPKWGTQELLLVTKDATGTVRTESLLPVRFVPLTGGEP